jgi:hypothetical protein
VVVHALKALFVCAQVQVAECLLEQAVIADQKLKDLPADYYDRPFYEGKISSARYYLNQVLPNAFTLTEIIKSEDASVLECDEKSLLIS